MDVRNSVSGSFGIDNFANAFYSQMKLSLPNMGSLMHKIQIHGHFRILTTSEKHNITHISESVLCGTFGNQLTGPFVPKEVLKLGQYLHVLKKELPGMLKDVSHQIRRHI
jgi:hypothetical protein